MKYDKIFFVHYHKSIYKRKQDMEPLAQRLRPRTLDEVCGQQHLLGKNQVFRRQYRRNRGNVLCLRELRLFKVS